MSNSRTTHRGRSGESARILKYLLFGGSAFAIDFTILWITVSLLHIPAWLGAVIAFLLSTIFAFFTQMRYTFQAQRTPSAALIRYSILLAANTAFTSLLVEFFQQHYDLYIVGKIVSTGCTTLWNYFIMKRWVFRTPVAKAED